MTRYTLLATEHRSRFVVIAAIVTQVPAAFWTHKMRPRAEFLLRTLIGASEMVDKRDFAEVRRSAIGTFLTNIHPMRMAGSTGVKTIRELARKQAALGEPFRGGRGFRGRKKTGIGYGTPPRRIDDGGEGGLE